MDFTEEERLRHLYIIGRTGMGKTNLLLTLAQQDIENGLPLIFVDPHGDAIHELLDCIPKNKTETVCYLDLTDREFAVGFNPLSGIPVEQHHLAATSITTAIKNIYYESWGPRLEHYLLHGIWLLIERGNANLRQLSRLYYDDNYRARYTKAINDPVLRNFWLDEYPNAYNDRQREEAVSPLLNKIGQIVAPPAIRNVLNQPNPPLNITDIIDHKYILLVNLAKGIIGEEPAHLLGSLLLSHIKTAAMKRATIPLVERFPFSLIVDEFQSFGTLVFAHLLSEGRKYGASLTVAHQFSEQLTKYSKSAILGNASTLVSFRVGVEDAKLLAPEFNTDLNEFRPSVLTELPPYHAWIKRGLYQHQEPVKTEPFTPLHRGRRDKIIAASRMRFARPL